MPSLPVISGRKTVRAFENLGWQVAHQRGSHIIMVKDGEIATLSIPDHKEIAKGAAQFDSHDGNHSGRILRTDLI